jgi:hypothetical protein
MKSVTGIKREVERFRPENCENMALEIDRLKREYKMLQEKYEDETKVKHAVFVQLVQDRNEVYNRITSVQGQTPVEETPALSEEINRNIQLKKTVRHKDGFYYLPEGAFARLVGTRQEVWDGIAYATPGLLKKKDLIIGVNGNVISKLKSVTASAENRLMTYMKKIGKVPV